MDIKNYCPWFLSYHKISKEEDEEFRWTLREILRQQTTTQIAQKDATSYHRLRSEDRATIGKNAKKKPSDIQTLP